MAWKASENELSVALAQTLIMSVWRGEEKERKDSNVKELHCLAGTAQQRAC